MARTIRSQIIALLGDSWTSRGELFSQAQAQGYVGSQARLLQRADELANQGLIEASQRGRARYNQYRLPPKRLFQVSSGNPNVTIPDLEKDVVASMFSAGTGRSGAWGYD